MSEVEIYIREQLQAAFRACFTCPACQAPMLLLEDDSDDWLWCGLCGARDIPFRVEDRG